MRKNFKFKVIVKNNEGFKSPDFINWNFETIENFIDKVVDVAQDIYSYDYQYCTHIINNRLRSTYARTYYMKNHIEISNFLINDYVDSFIKSTLIHEVCHALCYQFDGVKSRINHNHDKVFKSMCKVLCDAFEVPDGSKAFENGLLKTDYIKELEKRVIEVVEFSTMITKNIKYSFIKVVGTQLRKLFYNYILILDSS